MKFTGDKIFKISDITLISTEGIILNSKSLLNQYQSEDLGDLLLKNYRRNSNELVKDFRGNFSGFVYDFSKNKLIVFTDHLASKPIYYFFDKGLKILIFSSELKVVAQGMKEFGFEPCLDISASYCLLTLGYMVGDLTLIKEIKKLPPGNLLIYDKGAIELTQYYKLSSTPYIEESEEKIIRKLDEKFKEAVKLEYEKDLEYGYSHVATMSGGLDSRTNVAYAKKLNYKNITCFTFSQSEYLDEKIAKKICSDNQLDFIFYALDNGTYLTRNIDEIINSNDGLVFYLGAAHLYNCLKKIYVDDYGLIHTGQIGDLVLGSYLRSKSHKKVDERIVNKISQSNKLLQKLTAEVNFTDINIENDELLAFYEKCVNGVFNGYRMIEQFTEFSSPFLYLEFLEYSMRIHPKYRYKEAIYLKWITKCTPEFAKYKWEKYNMSPMNPLVLLTLCNKYNQLTLLINQGNKKQSSMNPTKYWWKNNKILQKAIYQNFSENISVLNYYPGLLEDSIYLFKNGSLIEKTQVLTLLRAIKILNICKTSK